jgi:hypothetical protein
MKKGNNSKMGNGIYFKIAGWVDLDMLHVFIQCQIFDIINGFWVITQNLQFYQNAHSRTVVRVSRRIKIMHV